MAGRVEDERVTDPGCQTIHSDPAGNALNPAEIHNHVRKVVVRVSVVQTFKILDTTTKCGYLAAILLII